MPCPSFEDLLLDYSELPPAARQTVNAHAAQCAACREYLETLAQLDEGLAGLYAEARTSPLFQERVISAVGAQPRLAKPTFVPEILDFVGGIGMLAAIISVAHLLMPLPAMPRLPLEFSTLAALGAGVIALLAIIWIGMLSHDDLKN
jgi:anti-sigma factor RsiW